MTLKELMQLCYNAGSYIYGDAPLGGGGWTWWWDKYGQERHDAFGETLAEDMDGPMARWEKAMGRWEAGEAGDEAPPTYPPPVKDGDATGTP